MSEVIERQDEFFGKRVAIAGTLTDCQKLSCGLRGRDRQGRERYLSIGPSDGFDAAARKLHGRQVIVEVTVTRHCFPHPDPEIIAACADRTATLIEPALIRTR